MRTHLPAGAWCKRSNGVLCRARRSTLPRLTSSWGFSQEMGTSSTSIILRGRSLKSFRVAHQVGHPIIPETALGLRQVDQEPQTSEDHHPRASRLDHPGGSPEKLIIARLPFRQVPSPSPSAGSQGINPPRPATKAPSPQPPTMPRTGKPRRPYNPQTRRVPYSPQEHVSPWCENSSDSTVLVPVQPPLHERHHLTGPPKKHQVTSTTSRHAIPIAMVCKVPDRLTTSLNPKMTIPTDTKRSVALERQSPDLE